MENKQTNQSNTIACPECDTPINHPSQIVLGRILECPACGTENEITSVNPLVIAPLEEEK